MVEAKPDNDGLVEITLIGNRVAKPDGVDIRHCGLVFSGLSVHAKMNNTTEIGAAN